MPFEKGGRSDKAGNGFEIKVVISQILKVLEEKLEYVILEALGEDENGVDLWIVYKDGRKEGQQCKSRNGSNEYWDFGTANAKGIFNKWKDQLDRGSSIEVSLVSPLAFTVFEDLIKRAINTSEKPNDFFTHQILKSSKEFIAFFKNFCRVMSLNYIEEYDLAQCINYLKRIHYRQTPDAELKETILQKIAYLFYGDEKVIYDQFVSWVVDGDILGKEITCTVLYQFINDNNIRLKNLSLDNRIMPRINELNQNYQEGFIPLNAGLFQRNIFSNCNKAIDSSQSLIIHGKAGRGKSGCTEAIIKYCKEKKIPHLALKLDKRTPSRNANQWGEELGLPASIAHCIHSISKEEKAVIILDQLDALRWTQAHSRDSLIVCSEIINQVLDLNMDRKHNISIVFVCRTIDLENDNNIKQLFKVNEQDKYGMKWLKVEVNDLDDIEVQGIVGEHYEALTKKFKDLLRIPSNLFIWQHLNPNKMTGEYSTTNHLISEWWQQLVGDCFNFGLNEVDLNTTKERLIEQFDRLGRIYVPLNMVKVNRSTLDFLSSNGFLIIQENKIFFSHQSILDYFLAEKMLEHYYGRINLVDIVGTKEKQTPGKRYQLQMLMQHLLEIESRDFIDAGKQLLNEESIRYYNKYVFLEILSQIENIDNNIEGFILDFCEDDVWGSHIVNNVIFAKPQFYRILRDASIIENWLDKNEEKAFDLLTSIRPQYEIEDIELIKKYALQSEEIDRRFLGCFSYDLSDDTDEMFELRMQFYNHYPNFADSYIDFKSMMKNCELRTIRYFAFLLERKIKTKEKQIYKYKKEFLLEDKEFLIKNGEKVIEILLPLIPKDSSQRLEYSDWSGEYSDDSLERVSINLLKKANAAVIKVDPYCFFKYYDKYFKNSSDVIKEITLDAFYRFPETLSDLVIEHITEEFDSLQIIKSSEELDELYLLKRVLKKHAVTCSAMNLSKLEDKIVNAIPTEAINILKSRMDFNKEKNGHIVYWSFWGEIQHELLNILPSDRLNKFSKDLVEVLNRKFINEPNKFKRNISSLETRSSPVDGKDLSAKQWLRIITNEKIKIGSKLGWKESPEKLNRYSNKDFPSSFRKFVSSNPIACITAIINSEERIPDIYIDSLYSGIAFCENIERIPKQLLEKMFKRYKCDNKSFRANYFCQIIRKWKCTKWSDTVINILMDIAVSHENPENEETSTNEVRTYDSLMSKAINCVRGSASHTIGELIREDESRFRLLRPTIDKLVQDKNSAVKLASIFAILPCFNINKTWASEKVMTLYEQDIRIAGFHHTKQLLFIMYPQYRERVLEIIKKCYQSDDKDLIKMGARCLAEMYILKNEFVYEMNHLEQMKEEQANEVLQMIMLYFNKEEFNSLVKEILLGFKGSKLDLEFSFSRLFHDDLINLDRDKDLLLDVVSSESGKRILHSFVEYLERESKSLIDFNDIILSLSENIVNNFGKTKNRIWGIDDEISKLIIELYDESSNSNHKLVNGIAIKCLDLWDQMFEKQIGSMRKLSFEMMDR